MAKRNFLNIIRLPQTSYVKILTTCMTALFAVLLFWFSGEYNSQTLQNVKGALFFTCMNVAMNAIQNVILIFPDERPVFLREVNNNMYKPGPYFWAKVFSELPFAILVPSLFGLIVYFAVGLTPTFEKFLVFEGILILIYNAASGYSLIISATFSDKQQAVTLTPVLIIPFMLFAGFFVASDDIKVWLKEFEYLSIFKYGYQGLMYNEFDQYFPSDGSAGLTDRWGSCTPHESCNPTGQLSPKPLVGGCAAALFGIYVASYIASWLILRKLSRSYE